MTSCRTLILFLLLFVGSKGTSGADAVDSRQPGPYQVGVRTEVFVDPDRTCSITQKPRTLVTEIWYPAAEGADSPPHPKNTFADFFGSEEGKAAGRLAIGRFGGQFDKVNESFKNRAYRKAPIQLGRFPLLIFSHGNGGFRHQNAYQAEHLASHGYIVAAPDHTGNAAFTLLPDQIVLYSLQTRSAERRDDRPRDVSFLLTHLVSLAGDHWLAGRVAADSFGLFGHSYGGFTVCRAVELDPRIKAILPMTLAATSLDSAESKPCPVPLLVVLGDKDRTVGERGNARSIQYFERAAGPKYLLNFKNAGHYTFTEMTQINPQWGDGIGSEKDKDGNVTFEFSNAVANQQVTNAYSAAFFAAFLKQDAAAKLFLDRNHYEDQLVFRKE